MYFICAKWDFIRVIRRNVFNKLKKTNSYSLTKADIATAFRKNNFFLEEEDIDKIYQMMIDKVKLKDQSEFSYAEFYDIMITINAEFLKEFRENKF